MGWWSIRGRRAQLGLDGRCARRPRFPRRTSDRGQAAGAYLSQEGFAALLGIAAKNVQRIEAGKQNLSLVTLERIAGALGTSPESLLAPEPALTEPPVLPSILARLDAAGLRVRSATTRGRRPEGAVPVLTLRAAAGALHGAARAVEILGWVTVPRAGDGELPPGHFVGEVTGNSMEPRISSGSLCLFGPAGPPPHRGRILLVTHGSLADDATGATFALKRIRSIRKLTEESSRVTLESINPEVAPIVIETGPDDELRVIAELVRVLLPGQ